MKKKLRYLFLSILVLSIQGIPLVVAQTPPAPSPAPAPPSTTLTAEPLDKQQEPLRLLQPLDAAATTTIAPSPGIGIIFDYFNRIWPWVLTVVAGIAVLNALIGGIMIIFSGGDATKRQEGVDKLLWSMAGFIILMLAGAILGRINPLFYK